jgi:hypothetical protein
MSISVLRQVNILFLILSSSLICF